MKSREQRYGYLILSEYGNVGGFFTNESEAKEHFEQHYKDEKGYYIFSCIGLFKGEFFMEKKNDK
jgi:hypothetical protein